MLGMHASPSLAQLLLWCWAHTLTMVKPWRTGDATAHLVTGGFDDGDVQGALLLEVWEGILQTASVKVQACLVSRLGCRSATRKCTT